MATNLHTIPLLNIFSIFRYCIDRVIILSLTRFAYPPIVLLGNVIYLTYIHCSCVAICSEPLDEDTDICLTYTNHVSVCVVSEVGPLLDIKVPAFTPVINRGPAQERSSGNHCLLCKVIIRRIKPPNMNIQTVCLYIK